MSHKPVDEMVPSRKVDFASQAQRRPRIHPTAIVDPRARLADDVTVGAYAIIEGEVTIGSGGIVYPHTVIQGSTLIGQNCRIGPAAYVGLDPQHAKFVADPANPTYLIIGNNVMIRECARLSRATAPGEEHGTRIGDNCFIMGASHVGHDCVVERGVTLADSALLGGHVHLGEQCFIGGGSTIHQFVHIGRLSIVAGNEAFTHDVPPFAAVRYGRLKAYNAIGCKRAGLSSDAVHAIRGCYHRLKEHRTMAAAIEAICNDLPPLPEILEIVRFIESSRRGILPSHCGPRELSQSGDEPAVKSPEASVDCERLHAHANRSERSIPSLPN
jgi:UDP-N-acetylglucosamine acyltransferase